MWHLSGCCTAVERISRQKPVQSLSFKTERRVATVDDPNATSYCRILALCDTGRSQGRRERVKAIYSTIWFKKRKERCGNMVVLMVAAATALRSELSAMITPSTPLNYLSHRGACSDQRGCFFVRVRLDCTMLIMTTRPPPPHPTASPSVSALRGEAWLAHMLICRQHQWLSVPLQP